MAPVKLFTIGDSISQGFMSLAAARTELSYSTLIARALGLTPGTDDYPIPMWGAGGIPLNIENLLRTLYRRYGSNVAGPIEWSQALLTINEFLDSVEDHYERGPGNVALPQAGRRQFFPNVAVAGFTIADAWKVTPAYCIDRIATDRDGGGDGLFALPNCRFERTASAVLNPSRNPDFRDYSQLEWLKHHHKADGVENLILWLGSNNALGTIVRMEMRSTTAAPKSPIDMEVIERDEYNLWSPKHFAEEFEELLDRTHKILKAGKCGCKVFVGTVPPVTIAPLAKGVGSAVNAPDPFGVLGEATYYENYTYFLFGQDYARRTKNKLTLAQALNIDQTIAQYNDTIKVLISKYNAIASKEGGLKIEYHVVDIADAMLRLAFKRNNGNPTYALPPALIELMEKTNKPVDTVYYGVDRSGTMISGGVFSLDGVHPSAIGQGLIAHEFITVMSKSGVNFTNNPDWSAIVASDSLYTNPIPLMEELYDNTRLAELVLGLLSLP
jgi:hypothetical protein